MRLADIERLSDDDLRARYDEGLAQAQQHGSSEILAQTYKDELDDRKENRRHRREDVKENLIILLISFELIVGIVTLGWTVSEFKKQNAQFDKQMGKADTQIAVLKNLLAASQESSAILRAGENRRLAALNEKPDVHLTLNGKPLPKSIAGTSVSGGREVDFDLINMGTANATGIYVTVTGNPSVSDIISNDKFEIRSLWAGDAGNIVKRRITVPYTLAKKGGKIVLSLTFRGGSEQQKGGEAVFEVVTDQHPDPIVLGSTTIYLYR
jgi:hypothetical protein